MQILLILGALDFTRIMLSHFLPQSSHNAIPTTNKPIFLFVPIFLTFYIDSLQIRNKNTGMNLQFNNLLCFLIYIPFTLVHITA